MEENENKRDFEALSNTIISIYDLRGIGVSAAYVSNSLWKWMLDEYARLEKYGTWQKYGSCSQCFDEAKPELKKTKTGAIRFTIQPYGADKIPVKPKYSGKNPWKIVCGYRKES